MLSKPTAFIQVDLDGLWAVRRCYGLPGLPEGDDPVYSQALPALLALFERLDIRATFFVVGADARVAWKRDRLERIRKGGHEIANHSMTHDLGFARLGAEAMRREIVECQETLRETLGVEARGFRAPGYGYSAALTETLEKLDFWYDASLLPAPWGWLLRWIDRRISEPPRKAKAQYGAVRGWRAPPLPHRPAAGNGTGRLSGVWEVPVSVSRRLRFPIHGGIGFLLGRRWVERGLRDLRRRDGFVNYLIHGVDLVDGSRWEITPRGRGRCFFAGNAEKRLDFFRRLVGGIREHFEVCRTDEWIERIRKADENR